MARCVHVWHQLQVSAAVLTRSAAVLQTGTGKTYTMEGFNSAEERGIIPRAIEQIFRHIQSSVSPRMRFLVRASYLQIYNEVISDLLKPERSNLVIREDKKKGVFVEGLSEWVVRSPQEIYGLMERGGLMRATGSTRMNELSSRSHAVFIIIAEQSETTYLDESGKEMSPEDFHKLVKSRAHGEHGLKRLEANVRQSFKVGKLNLVDLAGSERVRLTGATGQRLEESKKINQVRRQLGGVLCVPPVVHAVAVWSTQSLSALGNVIAALTDPRGRQHIPYRDSKLTRILEDSLGGNCKTTMMAMISPALESFVESLSTLKFANRAKNIKNEARVNEDLDQKSLLRRYERELKRLRSELEERHKNVVDKRKLLELEEERRRAEADKVRMGCLCWRLTMRNGFGDRRWFSYRCACACVLVWPCVLARRWRPFGSSKHGLARSCARSRKRRSWSTASACCRARCSLVVASWTHQPSVTPSRSTRRRSGLCVWRLVGACACVCGNSARGPSCLTGVRQKIVRVGEGARDY